MIQSSNPATGSRPTRSGPAPTKDAVTALGVLGWIVSEPARAQHFVDLTGQTPADLRARAAHPALWAAAMGFVMAHEPDLIACADQLGLTPGALAACAQRIIDGQG